MSTHTIDEHTAQADQLREEQEAEHAADLAAERETRTATVATWKVPEICQKVMDLNARANKHGMEGQMTVAVSDPYTMKIDRSEFTVSDVTVTGRVGLPGGFELVGTVDLVSADENLVHFPFLKDDENADDRYRHIGDICEHCNRSNVGRLKLIVVKDQNGREVAVGTTCAKDYFGIDAAKILGWMADGLAVFNDDYDPDDENEMSEWFGPRGRETFPIGTFVRNAALATRAYGYQRSGGFDGSTKETALHMFWRGKAGQQIWEDIAETGATVTDQEVTDAIEWARHLDDTDSSDFARNMAAVARSEWIGPKATGFAAYVFEGHQRHLGKEIERKAKEAATADSEWFGEVKERLTFTATIARLHSMPGFGYYDPNRQIVNMITEDGNVAVWFASKETDLKIGDHVTVTATVKEHDTYNGTKQTKVTRAKITTTNEEE